MCGSFFDSAVLLNYLSPTYFIVPTTKKRRKGKGGKKVNRSVGGKKRRLGGGGRCRRSAGIGSWGFLLLVFSLTSKQAKQAIARQL